MLKHTEVIKTFPSVSIPSQSGGLPVEVSLVAQLGHGSGNHLFASIVSRQRHHTSFVNELEEPSAKLGSTDFSKGDPTALYTFVVGPNGHPFHRHAGHRIFTAVSGSGGAQLRFSTATKEDIEKDPDSFIKALRFVNIPPDCLFTARFGGETWHQFLPLSRRSLHPAFFALSCHTNELGGDLPEYLKRKVLANDADIPSLTELLPDTVSSILQSKNFKTADIPTTTLSLDAPPGTFHRIVCNSVRGSMGLLRGAWAAWADASGFSSRHVPSLTVTESKSIPDNSLLRKHLSSGDIHHEDIFSLKLTGINLHERSASKVLASVLEGFLLNAPTGVSKLMSLRNKAVKPWGLRTSPLGCPVSSLLSKSTNNLFAEQYPVLDQFVNAADTEAQVVLGADDKHLSFRSCVGVKITDNQNIDVTLGTRVHCKNAFGKLYMSVIDYTHRKYVSPTILKMAVDYAIQTP